MNKLNSMWWHNAAENGPLAASYDGVVFCALFENSMLVSDIAEMEFDEIPNIEERKLSPTEYCIAYTDGVLYAEFIKPKYRKMISAMYENNSLFTMMADNKSFDHIKGDSAYTLIDSWKNVDFLKKQVSRFDLQKIITQ